MGHGKETKPYHGIQYFSIGLSTYINPFIHGNIATGRQFSYTTWQLRPWMWYKLASLQKQDDYSSNNTHQYFPRSHAEA
jgi:hypothetical protein